MKSKKLTQKSSNSESGVILPIVIILALALTITGLAFLNAGVMENSLVRREIHKNQAFWLAEAGLERTLWNLKQHFENVSGDWTRDNINGIPVADLGDGWLTVQYGESEVYSSEGGSWGPTPLSAVGAADLETPIGHYVVKLDVEDYGDEGLKEYEFLVESEGTVEGISKTVQMIVNIENFFPWANAIFAGSSAAEGAIIEGNVRIHGSVLILGMGPNPQDPAMEMLGDAGIRNNYEGMPDGSGGTVNLVAKVPSIFNNDLVVETLEAVLRVKYGDISLSGNATVGENIPETTIKRTMNAVYVHDDFVGSGGADHVYTDDGPADYDLGNAVKFPSLSNPYVDPDGVEPYNEYPTYLDYLYNYHGLVGHSLNLRGEGVNEISSDVESFWAPDPTGVHHRQGSEEIPGSLTAPNYIIWNKELNLLTINGIILVEESLDLGKKNETIEYSGSGTLVAVTADTDGLGFATEEDDNGNLFLVGLNGNIRVHGDLLAQGIFPIDALGLVTANLELATGSGESRLTMTVACFAENEIISQKQNEIAGTFISNHFDMGQNVPRIYQVPELAYNLPAGIPGGLPGRLITTSQWKEI